MKLARERVNCETVGTINFCIAACLVRVMPQTDWSRHNQIRNERQPQEPYRVCNSQ